MLRPSLTYLVLLGSPAVSQINFGVPGSQGNRNYSGSRICNKTFAAANSVRLFLIRSSIQQLIFIDCPVLC